MSFITNIRSVAKYESKILVRSWFFRIFTLLAVVFLGFFNFAMMLMEDNFGLWFAKSVSSNIPYLNLLLLNTGQAVVAVFLSSEFLKRDKKLDTSEVFYVQPVLPSFLSSMSMPKCRCTPVACPVLPIVAMTCPAVILSPALTRRVFWARW